jgi:ABC-type Na+ transport system ATPase subunit NatA
MLLMGIPSSKPSSNEVHGSIRFNLFDLYTHNAGEHDASLVREDHYFDELAQFNLTLFEQLTAPSMNDTLTFDNIFEHMKKRIIDSRMRNPDASFNHHPNLSYQIGANALALDDIRLDADLKVIRTDFLRTFLDENRIPDDFIPRSKRGLPLISLEDQMYASTFEEAGNHAASAISQPLTQVDENDNVTVPTMMVIGLTIVGVVTMLTLIGLFITWRRPAKNKMISNCQKQVCKQVCYLQKLARFHDDGKMNNTQDVTPEMFHDETVDYPCVISELGLESNLDIKLLWNNISVYNNVRKSKMCKILDSVSGFALAGHLTCILGHSGSGKSTLLNVLGGTLRSKSISFDGSVFIDGISSNHNSRKLSKHIAFVGQTNPSVPSMTPREAIRFSARLRLPQNLSESEIQVIVDNIIAELQLEDIQNRYMDDKHGLSGGEKRRVSLGIDLVTKPNILLLDEITSGKSITC